ncbi:hypothetical protein TIFTF001_009414 [Ficus carica]|uniref:Protein CLT2, chloroplastic n=1 Tax=Ficus carica TaxID=3494 RepID=A0AA88D1A5_FICCA|nr:hypothetical protein TIFTF001_009414 [Ficus carica]
MGLSILTPLSSRFPSPATSRRLRPLRVGNLPLHSHSHFFTPLSWKPTRSPRILLNPKLNLVNGCSTVRDFRAHTSSPNSPPPPPSSSSSSSATTQQQILLCSALTVAFAVANRVLYKLALVPMKEYPFFLAQVTTFGYVVVYFLILYTRYNAGVVTDEMIDQPKKLFVAIGALEALGVALGMASAAMLPGPAIPILNQTFLVWQLFFSVLILGRTYTVRQIAGCLLVATGIAVAVTSGSNADQMLSGVEFVWPALMIASCAFQAGASIIKEFVFIDAAARLKDKSLDIFVVNSFGSGFQTANLDEGRVLANLIGRHKQGAVFVLLFLPLLSGLKGIPFAQLPSYLKSGVGCFLNIGTNTSGKFSFSVDTAKLNNYDFLSPICCDGSPLLPLLYIATNLMFNISVLNLVKTSSAVVSSLAVMLSVPISIYILSIPLPYLAEGSDLSPYFLFGGLILVLGLVLYTLPQPSKPH